MFTDQTQLTFSVFIALLLFNFDLAGVSESFLIDLFFTIIFLSKWRELVLKADFILIYCSPWNLSWGSVFHATIHPLAFPRERKTSLYSIMSKFFLISFFLYHLCQI